MKAALYARVSTQRQAQAQTVEQQIERLTGHARQQGWDVLADLVFRDDGYSGASLRRPGLDRLRDRATARSLDLVLITAPDRLARNYVHQVLLLEELQGHGCEVQFLDRPMSQDPHDQLLLQIRGAVAEYERTLITERMRRGRQRKLEAGVMLPWTRAPFGYRVDPDRPRDPAGVRIEEAEAAIVREMFAWYADEAHSFCSLARLLEQRGIRTSTGLARWNLASIRGLLTNPAYAGQVYGNRWHRRGTLERRSATAPRKHSAMSRVDAPRAEWILAAEIPPLVSQEQFDRVQARLASNRRFAHRNNKAHPYLLRGLVSCGLCGLACLAWANMHRYRYYSCTGKLPALFSHREQKCPSRLSPAGRLDELVWSDLCDLLSHPEQASQALARAHGGHWLPQELQARQQGLRRGQASLGQQLERLTEAYLAGVVLLDEYWRRRGDLEERQRQLGEQAKQLEAQADRQTELAGLSSSLEDFCCRVRQGLSEATFEQRRSLGPCCSSRPPGWPGVGCGRGEASSPCRGPLVPFKANAARRHHIPKQRHRVTNWAEYDAGLRARGSLTVWFTPEAVEAWTAEPRTGRGGQPVYSALAIATALTLRAVFRLALRQTEGLIASVLQLLGLDLPVPDHSTLSRRAEVLEVPRPKAGSAPVHLLVDSTGLRLCGPGEWLEEKHGSKRRRAWRVLHLATDADTGLIVASALTDRDADDGSQVGPLLDQVDGLVASFTGDGAYDRDDVYAEIAARHPKAAVIVPPRANAVPSDVAETTPTQRDAHLQCIAKRGRLGWQRASGYNTRALVEADVSRWKRVIGDGLRSQTDGRQATEVTIAAGVLNRMLDLGRPIYVRIT